MTQRKVLTRDKIADAMEWGASQIREYADSYLEREEGGGYCGCADGALAVGLAGSPGELYAKYDRGGKTMAGILEEYGVPRSFSEEVSYAHVVSEKTTSDIVAMIRAGDFDEFLVEPVTA